MRILIADANLPRREEITDFIRAAECGTVGIGDSGEAKTMLARTAFNACIIAADLPQETGLGVSEWMRKKNLLCPCALIHKSATFMGNSIQNLIVLNGWTHVQPVDFTNNWKEELYAFLYELH